MKSFDKTYSERYQKSTEDYEHEDQGKNSSELRGGLGRPCINIESHFQKNWNNRLVRKIV